MQEYFSLGCEPPGACHPPVMDGHTGREDGAPCHPQGFIHIPVILAEISNRPQQKWTSRLSSRPLSAWVGDERRSPKLSKYKAAPHGTPQGLFTGLRVSSTCSGLRVSSTCSLQPAKPHMTRPQPPSPTAFQSSHT